MRLLSTILASLSAVLCLAVLFFWARSYSHYDGVVRYSRGGIHNYALVAPNGTRIEQTSEGRTAGLVSAKGSLTLASIVDPRAEEWTWFYWSHPIKEPLLPNAMVLMHPTIPAGGFSIGSGKSAGVNISGFEIGGDVAVELPFWRITIPYILLALLTAIPPGRWFMNYRLEARREREGRCINCGHDLRGQTTGKCPGCGTSIEE